VGVVFYQFKKYMNTIFKVGKIINPLKNKVVGLRIPKYREVSLLYPARLNAMALDPSKIALSDDGIYSPGEIVFPISIYKKITATLRGDQQIIIKTNTNREQLVRHATLLMFDAFQIKFGITIELHSDDMKHCGLGSSSGMIAATACAINELYGNPISKMELIQYLAQNHGEEIDNDKEHLQHVQCIGGSAAAGLVKGGMIILSGQSIPIVSVPIESSVSVVIGVPIDFVPLDAKALMGLEMANMNKFIYTGQTYTEKIAYRLIHETIPSMKIGDLYKASKLLFDYRFNYGSIENCSFVYPRIVSIAKQIRYLFEEEKVRSLALSSVGPAFFAITDRIDECVDVFHKNGLRTYITSINNDGYHITHTIPYEVTK